MSVQSLFRKTASHPTAANLLMLMLVLMGIMVVGKITRETFPDYAPSEVEVLVVYPGASAQDVEEALCRPLEDELSGMSAAEEVRCEAQENSGRALVRMQEGYGIDRFLSEIRTEVDSISTFPEQAEPPLISQIGQTEQVVAVAVSGPMSASHLKSLCEQMKARMLELPLVSSVNVLGFSKQVITIRFDKDILEQFGLSVSAIERKISQQNLDLPAGTIETFDDNVMIRFVGQGRSIAQLEETIVSSTLGGAHIRLGDIAAFDQTFSAKENRIEFDGQRACLLQVMKNKREDALRIADAVAGFVDTERQAAPETVAISITQDMSKVVEDRLVLLVVNGVEGFALVLLILWLFFSFRISFWVALGLPISFLASFFAMHLIGVTFNMLSMVGLLLALGLIMDDAIVIVENVAVHVQKGKTPYQAVVDGIEEVGMGVFSSFLTTVFVFGSIVFLIEGEIGKILWAMPVVLIMTLAVSLIEAFFILPNHLVHSASSLNQEGGRFRQKFDSALDTIREKAIGRVADWVVAHRYLTLGTVLAALLLSLGLVAGGVLKTVAFPDVEGDVVQARLLLPQGTKFERTQRTVAKLTEALENLNEELTPLQPDGAELIKHISVFYNLNADAEERGTHVATISVDLLTSENRNIQVDEFIQRWQELAGVLTDIVHLTFDEPTISVGGHPLELRLRGDDLEELKSASFKISQWFEKYDGVMTMMDDLRPGKPEIRARLLPVAGTVGLTGAQVADQLRSAIYGARTGQFYQDGESIELDLGVVSADVDTVADLERVPIATGSGHSVPLAEIAELTSTRGYGRIKRIDGKRTVTLRGKIDSKRANVNQIIQRAKKDLFPEVRAEHPAIRLSIEGQLRDAGTTQGALGTALLLGVLGIFALLSFQFRSYFEPFVIILAIPFALIGVIVGHLLLGYDLSMVSLMGFVSLAGVVVNDSIILVETIKTGIANGLPVDRAASQASRKRFRAILLTTLTTLGGLLPLLTESSVQAQVLIPLVVALVFGLVASTLLVLWVVPSIYVIFADFGLIEKAACKTDQKLK